MARAPTTCTWYTAAPALALVTHSISVFLMASGPAHTLAAETRVCHAPALATVSVCSGPPCIAARKRSHAAWRMCVCFCQPEALLKLLLQDMNDAIRLSKQKNLRRFAAVCRSLEYRVQETLSRQSVPNPRIQSALARS